MGEMKVTERVVSATGSMIQLFTVLPKRYVSEFLSFLLLSFLFLAAVIRPFPYGYDLASSLKYMGLAGIWSIVYVVSRPLGSRGLLPFYLFFNALVLYVDRRNFGSLSIYEALGWTLLVVFCFWLNSIIVSLASGKRRIVFAAGSVLFQTALLVIPVTILAYNISTGAAFNEEAIRAVLQTSVGEAVEFAQQFFGVGYGVLMIGITAGFVVLNLRVTASFRRRVYLKQLVLGTLVSLVLLGLVAQRETQRFSRNKANLAPMAVSTFLTYRSELRQFREMFDRKASGMPSLSATRDGEPRTFIVIIGESQNRNHMGAYGYYRDTTPWLSQAVADGQITLFSNVYSSDIHTTGVLSKALTEANQYNRKYFYTSPSLVDIANASGFNTVWITNHLSMGTWDNIVSIIGSFSHSFIKLNPAWGFRTSTVVHDGAAIGALNRVLAALDSSRNNLIVIHLMGSHSRYCSRFPIEETQFTALSVAEFGAASKDPDLQSDLNCYDNSIRYTDHVVQRLFEAGEKIPNIGFMFYFADHSEAVSKQLPRTSELFDFEMVQIPMFVWFKDEFVRDRDLPVRNLIERSQSYFTTDKVYDLLLGLMGITTTHYSAQSDLSSPSFRYSPGNLRVLDGQRPLSEDPLIISRRFVDRSGPIRILAGGSNTLGAMFAASRAGYAGFQIDVTFRVGRGTQGNFFEVARDEHSRSHADLNDYLAYAGRVGYARIVLDVQDFGEANIPAFVDALESLDRRQVGFKEKAIIQMSTPSPPVLTLQRHGWRVSYRLPAEEIEAAVARGDQERRSLAQRIAFRIASQGARAISFNTAWYPFVRDYLVPLLREDVVFHGWTVDVSPWKEGALEQFRAQNWFGDQRIETIAVPVLTDFRM